MKASLAAALLMFALGGSAFAQAPGSAPPPAKPSMNFRQACSMDVQKLCVGAQTKRDQHKCIRQNRAQLSPGCSSFLAARRAEKMQEKQQQGATSAPPPGH
jgi:hypothetical protein